MSKEFKAFKAHRGREIAAALLTHNASRNPAMDDCRYNSPSWAKVLADPTYRKIVARLAEAMAALPADMQFDQKIHQDAPRRWLHRRDRVERAYGADKTPPWLRADTPERFSVWLKSYAEYVLFLASDGDNASDNVLQESFAKAVDLARSVNLPPPPKPPSAPVTMSHGKCYLLELTAWAQAKARQPGSKAFLSDVQAAKPMTTRRKHRQTQARKPTAKQLEAVQIFGECNGNYSAAAKRLGLSLSAARERIQGGYKNAGQAIPNRARLEALRVDRRGQLEVSGDRRKH